MFIYLFRKRSLVVGIIVLFIGLSIIPLSSSIKLNEVTYFFLGGNTLYVGGSGGDNYTTIQSAIDDAINGDTVFVYDDSSPYYENVVVNKSINLIGENNETTVIDAQKIGTPIRIISDGCLVSGFTILNCEEQISQNWEEAVIKIDEGNDVIVKDNLLNAGNVQPSSMVNYGAIDLNGCSNCKIVNNYIVQNQPESYTNGIALRGNSSNNIISKNDISYFQFGLTIDEDGNNYNNIISKNLLHYNEFGTSICNSNNEFVNNTVENNTEVGINIQSCKNNLIYGNIVQYNGAGEKFHCGIELMGYNNNHDNYVSNNIISYNNPCGLQTEYSNRNIVTKNNFIDNYGETGTPEKWWGNAYVHIQDGFFKKDHFKNNYWSDSIWIFPKIIHGILEIMRTTITINWINIDWHPAKEPYDI